MPLRIVRLAFPILFVSALNGCSGAKTGAPLEATKFPELGTARKVAPGVLMSEVAIPTDRGSRKIWVYLPEKVTGKLPLILIGPAGSSMFHGMTLGDGDMDEQLPYASNGFAVVAYEIDGPMSENPDEKEIATAAQAFRDANAGVHNAKLALDFALAKLQIDPARIYTAGHSSAATLSLQVAENDARVKGCIAYAPIVDIPRRLEEDGVKELDGIIPGYSTFLRDVSPITKVDRLICPVFLFHAQDDSNVPVEETQEFAARLKVLNPKVVLEIVPTGDHYDSMIHEGIPRAIKWLKALK